jgi:four helix bundle protein
VSDHEKLRVWRESMDLVEKVYAITSKFPPEERFGLTIQMRRCAVSIPSNIAEGASRRNKQEFLQFLGVARSSLAELSTQLEISRRLGFTDTDLTLDIEKIGKLLNGLMSSIRGKK